MRRYLVIPLVLLTMGAPGALGECPEIPFCARIGRPGAAFFVGEATEERHRTGHAPEYRFRIREVLRGLVREAETVIVETEEGPPPAGFLLIEAMPDGDGALRRTECDYASPGAQASEALTLLRRPSPEASLTVKVIDERGRVPEAARVVIYGPLVRHAEPLAHFRNLTPGPYRLAVSAPGYETLEQDVQLAAGSCQDTGVQMTGLSEIAGAVESGRTVQLFDAVSSPGPALRGTNSTENRYRFPGLPPGRYVLRAGALFYPGTPHRESASVIQLGPGQRVEIDLWNLR